MSKSVNAILTGNLESSIECYPFFEGKEKHFLKALCVRIAHGSYVVPKGLYKTNDENRKHYKSFKLKFKTNFSQ